MVKTRVTLRWPGSVGNGLRAVPRIPERHGVRSLQNFATRYPAGPQLEPCLDSPHGRFLSTIPRRGATPRSCRRGANAGLRVVAPARAAAIKTHHFGSFAQWRAWRSFQILSSSLILPPSSLIPPSSFLPAFNKKILVYHGVVQIRLLHRSFFLHSSWKTAVKTEFSGFFGRAKSWTVLASPRTMRSNGRGRGRAPCRGPCTHSRGRGEGSFQL